MNTTFIDCNIMVNSYELFTEVVRCGFLGGRHIIGDKSYTLEPTLIRRYDFLRSKPEFEPRNEMNRLFNDFPSDFKGTAKSELYRRDGGWIERGYQEGKVKQFKIKKDHFLVPILSRSTIGIDTSSDEKDTYICFAFFDNYKSGYYYLENFLKLPKSKNNKPEFKWNKLNSEYRKVVLDNLDYVLKISCTNVMMVKTNALKNADEKLIDVFIKIIAGWFDNYNYIASKRIQLRKELFKLANGNPIHCDADFQPLTPDKIVKYFVKMLADGNTFDALHDEKDSHESEPIQLTDILCGALKQHIIKRNRNFLTPWEFKNKLKSKSINRYAKCYIWKHDVEPS